MTLSSERLGLVVLIAGAMIIGLSPICVRLSDAGPSATGFWRLAFAAPLLALLTAVERPPAEAAGRSRFSCSPLMLLAGALFAGDLVSWHYGVHFTSVANATVLPNATPILVTAAAWLLLRERPKPTFLLGMGLAIGGAVVMAMAQSTAAPTAAHGAGRAPLLGDALSLSAAFWYGGYFLVVRALRKTATAAAVMFWSGLAGLPLLLLATLLLSEPLLPATMLGWTACIVLGLVHATGQGAIAWALGRVPTALASVVVLVQPVVAAALGWVLFGEAVTPLQGVGAAVALAGVVVAQRSARTPPPPPEA